MDENSAVPRSIDRSCSASMVRVFLVEKLKKYPHSPQVFATVIFEQDSLSKRACYKEILRHTIRKKLGRGFF